jgi:kynurenine 3-monooxygenase
MRCIVILTLAVVSGLSPAPLQGLRAAIVGGGASGLLLAHRLLDAGCTVKIFEGRADPRSSDALEGRAYALGLGLRGRTAIRSCDEELWQSVKGAGFGSDRFTIHLPFGAIDLRKPDPSREPSVLIYQTALCGALLDELERRHASDRLRMIFERKVEDVDPLTGAVDGETFDLVAGCDGVNSATRGAIAERCPGFDVERVELPGSLKVVRLEAMPAPLAPDAVHLVPGKGGLAAFLEPTKDGACALLSWRPGGDADPGSITDADAARLLLAESFALIGAAFNTTAVGDQFVRQNSSRAATIRCNAYTYGRVALLGDAAHSTGGASGQGCNSALQDAAALADALLEVGGDVAGALETYAAVRLPEGHALLDLSVGPKGALRRARFGLSAVASSLLSKFGIGEPPLQTLLTTSLEPFADIRRRRDSTFGKFPSAEDFAQMRAKATAPMAPRDGRKTVRYARNPWDPPAPEAYYEVRFSPPRGFTYEALGSTAAKAEAGVTTTHRCSSLMEANALARRVLSRMPTLAIATFKVTSDSVRLLDAAARAPVADAADEWVGDYSDVANAAAGVASPSSSGDDDRQAVWDGMLQDLAEKEAAEARTDVDEQWSAYLRSLQVTREIDAVMIGGVDGPAPCPLCNGKGVRVMFGKESKCEWCDGQGYVD